MTSSRKKGEKREQEKHKNTTAPASPFFIFRLFINSQAFARAPLLLFIYQTREEIKRTRVGLFRAKVAPAK
jgi:hypothetical protein